MMRKERWGDYGQEATKVAEKSGTVFAESPTFVVLWAWMDDHQRLVVYFIRVRHMAGNRMDDRRIQRIPGVLVVSLLPGKADYRGYRYILITLAVSP